MHCTSVSSGSCMRVLLPSPLGLLLEGGKIQGGGKVNAWRATKRNRRTGGGRWRERERERKIKQQQTHVCAKLAGQRHHEQTTKTLERVQQQQQQASTGRGSIQHPRSPSPAPLLLPGEVAGGPADSALGRVGKAHLQRVPTATTTDQTNDQTNDCDRGQRSRVIAERIRVIAE